MRDTKEETASLASFFSSEDKKKTFFRDSNNYELTNEIWLSLFEPKGMNKLARSKTTRRRSG